MAYASYIYQDQYIQPENATINHPSPPLIVKDVKESFQEVEEEPAQINMDPVLMDFLNQQMAPAVEQFEKEQRRIKYYRTSAYYFSILIMIIISFFYTHYFIKIFGMKFKN